MAEEMERLGKAGEVIVYVGRREGGREGAERRRERGKKDFVVLWVRAVERGKEDEGNGL